jgi:uncharacterized caspase-like protein
MPLKMKSDPKKGTIDHKTEVVPLNYVLKELNKQPDTISLVLLDCCRANDLDSTFTGTKATGMLTRTTTSTQRRSFIDDAVSADPSTQFLVGYACDPGAVAFTSEGRKNSYYTEALLKHLPKPGRPVSLTMQEVRKHVLEETEGKQKPWEHTCLTAPLELVPKPEPEPEPEPPPEPEPEPPPQLEYMSADAFANTKSVNPTLRHSAPS